MANPSLTQNVSDPVNSQEGTTENKKLINRRSWLRGAALAAGSALVLSSLFTSCTKDHWDDIREQLPGGGLGSSPSTWYYLKVNYRNRDGGTSVGYLAPIGENATTAFYDYMKVTDYKAYASKFKLHDAGNGWKYWEVDDGNWLSLRFNGWAYRSTEGNRVGWKIVNNKLYTNYSRWQDYPMGAQWRDDLLLIPFAYYVGANLGDDYVMTCELVPA